METLPEYGLVWYAGDALAKISLSVNIFDTYNVDLIKKEEGTFIIWAPKNDIVFKRHASSLSYHKVGDSKFVFLHKKHKKQETWAITRGK